VAAKVDKARREAVRETRIGLSVLIIGAEATKHIFSCSSLVVQAKAGRLTFSSADILLLTSTVSIRANSSVAIYPRILSLYPDEIYSLTSILSLDSLSWCCHRFGKQILDATAAAARAETPQNQPDVNESSTSKFNFTASMPNAHPVLA
jgi:hypothetical protein